MNKEKIEVKITTEVKPEKNFYGFHEVTFFGYIHDQRWTFLRISLSEKELEVAAAEIAKTLAGLPKPMELKEPEVTHTTVFDPFSIPTPDPELVKVLAEPMGHSGAFTESAIGTPVPTVPIKVAAGRVFPLADEGPGYGD